MLLGEANVICLGSSSVEACFDSVWLASFCWLCVERCCLISCGVLDSYWNWRLRTLVLLPVHLATDGSLVAFIPSCVASFELLSLVLLTVLVALCCWSGSVCPDLVDCLDGLELCVARLAL